VDVTIEQIGSDKLLLAIDSGPVRFEGAAEQACVEVTATVPAWIANDPDFQEDGTKLGGIIRLATPPRSHLDTVTTVKVSFTLTHPSATACVRALHLVANHSFDNDYSDAGIALSFQTSQGKLSSSPNDLQHLLALVNSCTYQVSVDLNTAINENFDLHQTSAVRTTALEQVIVDIDDLLDVNLNWDNLTNQGGNMCLQGIVIPARQTFVLAQRNRIKEGGLFPGEYADNLDPSRALGSWEYDGYTYATHLTGGTECADLAFSTDVDPSQGSVAVPVNEVSFTGTQPTEYPPQE
jgi:hypothetical protein